MSSFRPPRRSGWRAPWVSGVLAVLVAAALAGAGAAAGAQEAPDAADTATSADAPGDTTGDTTTGDTTGDTTTDTTAGDATDDTTTDTTAADDTATTDTTAADDGDDPAADPNGNINNLPLNSGIQTGTVFNPTPYGEVPGNTPQVLIQRPGSGRIVPLNRELTVRVRFTNFQPGFFSDPKAEYGVGTQRLNAQRQPAGPQPRLLPAGRP